MVWLWVRGVLDPEASVAERALSMLMDALLLPASKLVMYVMLFSIHLCIYVYACVLVRGEAHV